MKIALITPATPSSENINATSALPYHIALNRDKNTDLYIYSFNINRATKEIINKTSNELNAEIHIIPVPKWYKLLFKLHLLILRVLLPYPLQYYLNLPQWIYKRIKNNNPDIIWIYGEELAHIA